MTMAESAANQSKIMAVGGSALTGWRGAISNSGVHAQSKRDARSGRRPTGVGKQAVADRMAQEKAQMQQGPDPAGRTDF
jgi:hypothetical protein